jgi:hypothetical protein
VDEQIRRVVGVDLTAEEARALAEWYATQSRLVAAFPADDLKGVEPPLRSVPGPTR